MSKSIDINNKQCILDNWYREREDSYTPRIINSDRFNTPVNFKESMSIPRHRWYTYKEGFSPLFVRAFIDKYSTSKSDVVFDPFGGVGTTVLEASIMGYEAFSTDVNPLGNFASRVKSTIYTQKDIDIIKTEIANIVNYVSLEEQEEITNATVASYFDPVTLNSVYRAKEYIKNIKDSKVRDLFHLSLMSLIEFLSTHRKDGNGVKRKRLAPLPVSYKELCSQLQARIELYISDICASTITNTPKVLTASCLDPITIGKPIDIVITSPPYANCFDYSKVYMTELYMGDFFKSCNDQASFREKSITSHVHYKWKLKQKICNIEILEDVIVPILGQKKLWSKNIPSMLQGYFSDMSLFLENLSQHLNANATVGIVVGNSVYAGVVIATDLMLAYIAEQLGYQVSSIDIYRKLTSSSQQMKIINDTDKKYLRESLIILKWNN